MRNAHEKNSFVGLGRFRYSSPHEMARKSLNIHRRGEREVTGREIRRRKKITSVRVYVALSGCVCINIVMERYTQITSGIVWV